MVHDADENVDPPFSIARSDNVISSEVAFAIEDATELFSSDSLVNITTNTIGGAMQQNHSRFKI